MLTQERVMTALRTVQDPELFKDIVTLGMVKHVRLDGGVVHLHIELTTPACPMKDVIERDIRAAMTGIGATDTKIEFGAQAKQPGPPKSGALPQIKHVIAVGAGKGGVGKSTIAVNLAVGLQRNGATVGLLDGDIYGPSLPTMLGIKGVPMKAAGNKITPLHVHGIHAVTIGSLVDAEKPLIWRGPMAHGAFKQLLTDNVAWPTLDYLIVDLPPGTGDVPLSLCQSLQLAGAVVVATPQQVALDDAVRAVKMFQQLGAPVLGMVENMSYFVAPDNSEHDIFGRGGTRAAAERLQLPFLGEVPMFTELRVNSDAGRPHKNFESPRLGSALETVVRELSHQVHVAAERNRGPVLNVT